MCWEHQRSYRYLRMNKLLLQGSYFTLISGIGWCIDFGMFAFLSIYMGMPIHYANMLSSIPAVTFVFFFATRYIFSCKPDGLSLKVKYIIYLLYQICLIYIVSLMAKWIYDSIMSFNEVINGVEVIAKLLITPITMMCNFIMMKTLGEKI